MKKSVRFIVDIIFVAVLVFIDQFTKVLAYNNLKDNRPIEIIPSVLQLYYLPNGNRGAAFGIMSGHKAFFVFVAIVVVLVIFFALQFIPATKKFNLFRVMLLFIAAGGIGNMIDRIRLDFVIDFIYFCLINFPIFNVADVYVTVSAIVVIVLIVFVYKDSDLEIIKTNFNALFKKGGNNEGV